MTHSTAHSLALVAVCLLVLPAVHAAELRISGLVLAPLSSGTLRIELNAPAPAVGVQLDLLYPADQVVLGLPERGAALGTHALRTADVAPGRHRLLVYSARNQHLASGVLAEIPVTHVGPATQGSFPLLLANAIVATPVASAASPLTLVSSEIVIGSDTRPALSAIARGLDGRVQFVLDGTVGRTYQIETSTDLRTWTDLRRQTMTGPRVVIEDLPPANVLHRFYRARLIP